MYSGGRSTLIIGRTSLVSSIIDPVGMSLLNERVGGSSGGESALIAFHGSPLGIGTEYAQLFVFSLTCGSRILQYGRIHPFTSFVLWIMGTSSQRWTRTLQSPFLDHTYRFHLS